jgi:hypothetical protein
VCEQDSGCDGTFTKWGEVIMQRRTFVASLASAFSLSVLARGLVMPQQTVIPWERFCDHCEYQYRRYGLKTPWRVGERTVASDSRFLIATDGYVETAVEVGGDVRRPDAARLAWDEFETGGFRPLKITNGPLIDTECPTCLNVKALQYKRCPMCDREGESDTPRPTAIVLGSHFDPTRLGIFSGLGDVEVKMEQGVDCLLLRGDGWKGMLMGRLPD